MTSVTNAPFGLGAKLTLLFLFSHHFIYLNLKLKGAEYVGGGLTIDIIYYVTGIGNGRIFEL